MSHRPSSPPMLAGASAFARWSLRVGTRRLNPTPPSPEGTCSALGARRINKPFLLEGTFFLFRDVFHLRLRRREAARTRKKVSDVKAVVVACARSIICGG